MAERKVCVVTGSRADYSVLRYLLNRIGTDPAFRVQLVVTGSHLSAQFGETWRHIVNDGFSIDERVPISLDDDSPAGVARATGECISAMGEAYARLAPDVILLQGDRYEILASAIAAHLSGIPIAHTHGGELTEGAVDDAFRHAITKMASLHFVAMPEYAARVVQLGEDPDRVFTVGHLAMDALRHLPRLDRSALESELGVDLAEPLLLVTYHPETIGHSSPHEAVGTLLAALDRFSDANIVFTARNADAGHREIGQRIREWAAAREDRASSFDMLGLERYLSLMTLAHAVVGNSSSGVIEAPALGVPSVNIGDRQKNRFKNPPPTVIDCRESVADIETAVSRAISPEFRRQAKDWAMRSGEGNVAERICRVLREVDLATLARKRFHDLPAEALA